MAAKIAIFTVNRPYRTVRRLSALESGCDLRWAESLAGLSGDCAAKRVVIDVDMGFVLIQAPGTSNEISILYDRRLS